MDYKEKLRLAKEALDSGSYDKETIEYIFPELKESKDEEIRKALLRFHKSTIDIDGIKCEDILAWLEKQGQQPTIEMKSAEESLGIDSDTYNKIVNECIYGEQKPAWSEDDEDMHYKAMAVINRLYAEGKDYVWSTKTLKKLFYWIKSLKDRIQPQQEYSEEDEDVLEDIEEAIINYWHGDTQNILLDWLKSIRPQSQWKPSKEQMEALLSEVNGWTKGCPKQKVLESLYNDLMKLYGTDRKKEVDG